jgi:hypothetical protein
MSYFDYEKEQAAQLNNLRAQMIARPLNLGGTAIGGGGPTGGFTGYLPQSRVSYDPLELEALGITNSGSLNDNLNHIRYRLRTVESGLANIVPSSGIGGHVIKYNGVVVTGTTLDFTTGFTLTDTGDTIVFTSDVVPSGVTFPYLDAGTALDTPLEDYSLFDIIEKGEDGETHLVRTEVDGDDYFYLAVARDGGWGIADLNFPSAADSGKIPIANGKFWDVIDPRDLVIGSGLGGGGVDLSKITVIPGYGNTTLSGVTSFPFTHTGFQQALASCESYKGDVILLPPGELAETDIDDHRTYATYTVIQGTNIIGYGMDATTLYGQLNLLGSAVLKEVQIRGTSKADQSWVLNGNNTYQYFENISVLAEPFDESSLVPVALHDCSFAYSRNCNYRTYDLSGAVALYPFSSSLSAAQQISYPIGGYARGTITTAKGLGLEQFTKSYTNFASWDMFGGTNAGTDKFHANDIASGIYTRHLPLPSVSGMIPVANGTSWGLTTLPTGTTLTVKEVDNSPSVSASTIVFPNGTLTESGGVVTYTPVTIVGSGTGDVLGPASAVDGHLAVFDGTSGKILKDGGAIPTGTGGGGYTLIQEIVLGADGIFTFTGIPQTYKHLKIIGNVRSTYAATSDNTKIHVGNGSLDTGNSYTYALYKAGSGTAGSNRGSAAAYLLGGTISAATDTANFFSPLRVDIYFYTATDQFKTFDVQTTCLGTAYWSSTGGGIWASNSAIDTVSVFAYGTASVFKAGSRITLYGLS